MSKSPFQELEILFQFPITCIRALEHRIPTLSDNDIIAERKIDREYQGVPPIHSDVKFSEGVAAGKTTGMTSKGNEGHIQQTFMAMTSRQNKCALSVPLNSMAVKCLCPEESCEYL